MKRLFLFVYFSSIVLSLWAVKAYPGLLTYLQPDGTEMNYYLRGDENFSFKMSEDGYLLTLNEEGIFEYADLRDGDIVSLGVKASDVLKRSAEELEFLKNTVKFLWSKKAYWIVPVILFLILLIFLVSYEVQVFQQN